MMLKEIPFKAQHLDMMRLQDYQRWAVDYIDKTTLHMLEGLYAVTIVENGVPIACGGAVPAWQGRAYLWSYISDDMHPRAFLKCHSIVKRFIESLPFKRVETPVQVNFEKGIRWVEALGMKRETAEGGMAAYLPNGDACHMYSIVRED